jgi:endonuclease YncB( thermonuclease family)
MKINIILAGFILIFSYIYGVQFSRSITGKCQRVVDGDTVYIGDYKIRIMGIDAFESDQYSFDGKPLGKWSTVAMTKFALNKVITAELFGKDRYGRWLGKIYNKKGEDLGLKLLRKGHALIYPRTVFENINEKYSYIGAYLTARRTFIGAWSTRGFYGPGQYRKSKRK